MMKKVLANALSGLILTWSFVCSAGDGPQMREMKCKADLSYDSNSKELVLRGQMRIDERMRTLEQVSVFVDGRSIALNKTQTVGTRNWHDMSDDLGAIFSFTPVFSDRSAVVKNTFHLVVWDPASVYTIATLLGWVNEGLSDQKGIPATCWFR